MSKICLIGLPLNELKTSVLQFGMPAFTGMQIAEWLYAKRAESFDEMTNISLKNRQLLSENFEIGLQKPVEAQESIDGTKKYLFTFSKRGINTGVETVYIPDGERATLCVSTQVGCKMNCNFCMTGQQGFAAQLSVNEILNQIISIPESKKLTNIVFMGMGEPLDNLDNLLKTIEILTATYGLAMSPHRITVSTIGVLPAMKRFLDETDCHLAVSLHTPSSAERQAIMPVEKVFPAEKIIAELRNYDFSHQRRLSFEYIMFADFNDTPRHAAALARLLNGLQCRVNLIRFHAIPNSDFKTSNERKMLDFQEFLNRKGIVCTIRRSRGEDIFAACGMLSTNKIRN